MRSTDLGTTWERSEGLGLPEESGLKLASTWHLEPGHASQPGTLWLGGEPGVLFRSGDSGANWQVNDALLGHETRDRWAPGAGGLITHSITLDRDDPQLLWIGISAAGVFRSEDGGGSWQPANQGTEACFLPEDRFPELGQCVHNVLAHPGKPGRLWQQNHCGVYRSDDGGTSWERLEQNGLPSGFGFGLALDPSDPDTAFVIPEESAENRVTCNGQLGIYRTTDAGASWELGADRGGGAGVGGRPARGDELRRRGGLRGRAERPRLRAAARRGDRGGEAPAADPLGRGRGAAVAVAVVLLPGLLATEAGGQKRFEVDAATVGAVLRALPVVDLVLDERGEVRSLVHVYVDGERAHDLAAPVGEQSRIRIVAAIAGG